MEPMNDQQAIWQRVRSFQTPESRLDLRALVLAAGETEAALRRAAALAGGQRQLLQALAAGAAEEVATLRGIHWLDTGKDLPRKPLSPPGGTARELLRRSYFQSLKAQGEYTARALENQFGGVFQSLAQQMGARCQAIARILGTMA